MLYNFSVIKQKVDMNYLVGIKNDSVKIFDLDINFLMLAGILMIIIGIVPMIRRKIKEGKYTREVNAKIVDIEETI